MMVLEKFLTIVFIFHAIEDVDLAKRPKEGLSLLGVTP